MIYFDHNSTAPYSPSVKLYLQQGILEDWHNPSSVCPQSQGLNQKINECRRFIADYLNCSSKNLFFTSGATESINTVLSFETLRLNKISSIITSYLEHQASMKKIKALSCVIPPSPVLHSKINHIKHSSIKTFWIPNNKQGEINLKDLDKTCSKHPCSLLSFLSANNETGVITDVKSITRIAKQYDCLIHVDAVQSLGKTPIDLEDWDADFVSFSGHKIGAMKGIGLLYAKKPFAPLIQGGEQERGYRAGTYNYPAIQSFKLAVQDIDFNKQKYVKNLRDYFEITLLTPTHPSRDFTPDREPTSFSKNNWKNTLSPFFKVNCRQAHRLPNTSSVYCGKNVSNQSVLFHLAKKGICVSAGSACHAGSPEPSHVITALGICEDSSPEDYARSCIRISLSPANTKQEINYLVKSLKEFTSSVTQQTTNPSLAQTM